VRIAGPRSDFLHTPGKHLFLLGDETAIPAITAILEAMDPEERAVVVVEVATPEAVQQLPPSPNTHVSWITSQRMPGLQLAAHVKALTLSPESSQVWVGCEATSARELRRALGRLGFDRSALHVSGYWKHGECEHVDHDSDY
jgi:NADPH-dependent ferric siderophore reductase